MIELNKITITEGTQSRVVINQQVVAEYAEALTNGVELPPIVLFFDGTSYYIADGWHRFHAHRLIGALTILEDVRVGTKRDAQRYSLSANSTHGLPRTNADKRKSVEIALADEEWSCFSNRDIAKLCAVGDKLVGEVRNGVSAQEKTAKNKEIAIKSNSNNDVVTNDFKSAPRAHSDDIPAVENQQPTTEPDDEYTELDAAHDTIIELQDRLAVVSLGASDEERASAKSLLDELRHENAQLKINLAAVTSSRDSLMRENAELKKQCASQRALLSKK